MAIPFAYLAPVHLTEHGGATSTIAYVARNVIDDPRFEQPLDYSHLRADLAWEEVILPEGCSPAFRDRSALAVALDEAEMRKVRTPLTARKRRPQVGLGLVLALPPSDEVSIDEAAEILRRVVLAARGSEAVPIHLAIHEARVNRHGHALFALRSVDRDGVFGMKLRDFIARVRHTAGNYDTDVVEGVHWPDLSWEVQQSYFHELGIDLVVDPIAPRPGKHLSPVVYGSGKIINKTNEQIAFNRSHAYAENVRAIEGSPSRLIETLLRGRSSLRTAEIERLCAKFLDSEADQDANAARILTDQNIITLSDPGYDRKPRYVTTRRMHRLLTRAAALIDRSGESQIRTFTGINGNDVLAQMLEWCVETRRERPLILGAKLSDCDAAKIELAACAPIAGTVEMAVTGSQDLRAEGRRRDVCLRTNRPVIVPHAELIDDYQLARLIIATRQIGTELVLGHDQSNQTGVVCRHLPAYAADRTTTKAALTSEDRRSTEAVRLLRAGLVRHAIDKMTHGGLLEFGSLPNLAEDAPRFVVCDDPRRLKELSQNRRFGPERSAGIDLSEAVLSLREARGLSAEARLAVEATAPRNLWSALLLVASRGQNARLHVIPALARSAAELVDVARSSLPGALPHERAMRKDPDAAINRIVSDMTNDLEVLPETTPVEIKPPRPIHATEDVRRLLAHDRIARHGYRLLYDYVGPHNVDRTENTTRALSLYCNELTRTVVRFLGGVERKLPLDPNMSFDLPSELEELEPERWDYLDVYQLRTDLRCLTIPGRNCPINPASNFAVRRLSRPHNELSRSAT
ncbi:MobA/MobL family protein [Bradyrhizobium sp. cf659]|uniref:MobA/MobL family protein n=1 Tax=Bradyrhizobium sp. cf659 TaxID=1761771 RepID=UPI000A7B4ED1|nr:MobA/MobL family protein [Bradyrhizobium sp. cf659]